jgi:hypothetical protein
MVPLATLPFGAAYLFAASVAAKARATLKLGPAG